MGPEVPAESAEAITNAASPSVAWTPWGDIYLSSHPHAGKGNLILTGSLAM